MKFKCIFKQTLAEELKKCFDKYLVKIMDFKKLNCKELVVIAELNGVASLCKLFDSLGTAENGVCISILSSFMFFIMISVYTFL